MHAPILLTVLAAAQAFNFGGFAIPSMTVLPSIPADLASLIPANIPSLAFNRSSEFPSVPAIPSIDLDSYRSAIPDYKSLLPTALPASLGISFFPIPSVLPTLDDFGLRDNDLIDFWRTNHTLKVPESEGELRDFLGNHTHFDFDRADAAVDRLGEQLGRDIRPSIRLIAGLVLNNQSFDQVYKRATKDFTVYSARLRDGAKNTFNFTESMIAIPSIDLANRTLSVISYVQDPYSVGGLNSSVISIMVGDMAGNETKIRDLAELLNFTLSVDAADGACVYWNETVAAWATDGCQLLGVVGGIATCGCNHLTDFAFIAVSPSSGPSPTIYLRPQNVHATEPTPNGTSQMVIGIASAGSVLGFVTAAAIYLNIRHGRRRRIKNISAEAPGWITNNMASAQGTHVVVKA